MKYIMLTAMIAVTMLANMAFAAQTPTAKAGKYTVTLTTQPASPTVGDNHVTLTVKDGDKPVNGAGVSLHVDMVGMSMPADVKAAPGTSDGQYVATVPLGMAGQWKLNVNIQGMAGMAMEGDGTASFTVTAQQASAGNSAPGASANTPAQPASPAAPASLPWPLIIGGVAVVGVVVVVLMRACAKRS